MPPPDTAQRAWAQTSNGSRLPHDLDAERDALAMAVRFPRKIFETSPPALNDQHFYAPHHQALWRAVEALGAEREEAQLEPICERLRSNGDMHWLKAHGEDQYVLTLASEAESPDGFSFLCRRLTRIAAQRASMLSASVASRWKVADRVTALWSEPPPIHIPLGIEPLDRALGGGLMEASVTLLCGGTGRGKTGLVVQIARSWIEDGAPVLFIETELGDRQVFARFLAPILNRPWLDVFHMGTECAPELAELADRHLPTLEVRVWRPGEQLADIIDRFAQATGRSPRVIIDHLSDIARAQGCADARHATQRVSAEIKAIALNQKATILAVHPVARHITGEQSAGRRGRDFESSGKDAGELEYDAAAVLYLDCPRRKTKDPAEVFLHVAKSRGGPPDQVVPLIFSGALGIFEPASGQAVAMEPQKVMGAITALGGRAGINKLAPYLKMGQAKLERCIKQLEAAGHIKRTPLGITLAGAKASP